MLSAAAELSGTQLTSQYLIDKARQAANEKVLEKEDDNMNSDLVAAKAGHLLVPEGKQEERKNPGEGRWHLLCKIARGQVTRN
jgi:hypothetical protein